MSEQVKTVELKPIKETLEDFDEVERKIKELFKREIYYPALAELSEPRRTIMNAMGDALLDAIRTGRVQFSRGRFAGKFSAAISRDLAAIGAKWDRKTAMYKITVAELPREVRSAVAVSESRFSAKLAELDKKLSQILPEQIADKLKVSAQFDRTLWKVERSFQATVRGLTIAPELTRDQRKKIADEWQNNMRLWIADFTQKNIVELRKDLQAVAFSGTRREASVKAIQDNYEVSANKAKFLARQETSLLMTKFKETRYVSAGVTEYKWGAVTGTPAHPVRPRHKELADESKKGKIFRWDDPPVTTASGETPRRNNPGQDYNCRCYAIPVVRFRKDESS